MTNRQIKLLLIYGMFVTTMVTLFTIFFYRNEFIAIVSLSLLTILGHSLEDF